MADSVRERIMKHIQTTLEGITVANGYGNTLTAVERVLQQGQTTQPPMAYVIEGDDDAQVGPLFGSNGLLSRSLQVGVVLVVQQETDIDSKSASEVMNCLIADVQKAMQADHTRGGLAINTEETSVSAVQIDEGMPVLSSTVAYRVAYRQSRLDPEQAG